MSRLQPAFSSSAMFLAPMRTLIVLIFAGITLFPVELAALDFPKLAGRFDFTLVHADGRKDQVGEIEITYFKDFRFPGADVGYEALQFENERIAVIKDKSGKSMLADEPLMVRLLMNLSRFEAKESANSISSQPAPYVRLRLDVTDVDHLTLSITYKEGALNIGPHISLFQVWPSKPTTIVYLKRTPAPGAGKPSATPAQKPKGIPDNWPKFEQ
jgi:hypothetical protein